MYHYIESGLDDVFLIDGYTIEHDPEYGDIVSFDDIDGLHKTIGKLLIESNFDLSGKEIRFLRKEMGLTQQFLGLLLGYPDDQSVAAWEKDVRSIPRTAQRMLRLIYARKFLSTKDLHALIDRFDEQEKPWRQIQVSLYAESMQWQYKVATA